MPVITMAREYAYRQNILPQDILKKAQLSEIAQIGQNERKCFIGVLAKECIVHTKGKGKGSNS